MSVCEKCKGTGRYISRDMLKVMVLCGHCKGAGKEPKNLPKAGAYSLLAEVRADLQEVKNYADWYLDYEENKEALYLHRKINALLNKIEASEHFS